MVLQPQCSLGESQCTIQVMCCAGYRKSNIIIIFWEVDKRISDSGKGSFADRIGIYWQKKTWGDHDFYPE